MNQRKFVLSWGRKIFFGLSWPLSMLLGTLYLYSAILPQTAAEFIFYGSNFVAHTGVLHIIAYFLLYCPIVLIFPSYYISRIWTVLLIIITNLVVFFDGVTFAQYQLHTYSFLRNIFLKSGPDFLFPSAGAESLFVVGILFLAVVIWLRGEFIWRSMQRRFSNPVKNWYLVLIVVCTGVAYSMINSTSVSPSLLTVFPLSDLLHTNKASLTDRSVFYPKGDLKCEGKSNPNLVLVTIKEWDLDDFNETTMPKSFHLKRHGKLFQNHRKVNDTAEAGLFSMLYSLPNSFGPHMGGREPAFVQEMKKRNYEILVSDQGDGLEKMNKISEWSKTKENGTQPYFISLSFNNSSVDDYLIDLTNILQARGLLENTHIILASAHSSSDRLPLVWFSPDRKSSDVSHMTTAYDVAPTIMQKLWSCKDAFKNGGFGEPLDTVERKWYIYSHPQGFSVINVANGSKITLINDNIEIVGDATEELIFKALKKLASFRKAKRE